MTAQNSPETPIKLSWGCELNSICGHDITTYNTNIYIQKDLVSYTWQVISIQRFVCNEVKAVIRLHVLTPCNHHRCILPVLLHSNHYSLYKPKSSRLSRFHISLSFIIPFSHQIILSTSSWILLDFCNMNFLRSSPNNPSSSSKAPSSFKPHLLAPSSWKPLPSQSTPTPVADRIIDLCQPFEADKALVKPCTSSVIADPNPSVLFPEVQACIERNKQEAERRKEAFSQWPQEAKKLQVSPPVSPPLSGCTSSFLRVSYLWGTSTPVLYGMCKNQWLGCVYLRLHLSHGWAFVYQWEVDNSLVM